MTYKSQLGQLGEDIACEYLVKNKYKIIGRNFRQKWGELDIIATAPDKTLVFAEVKTMTSSGDNGLKPEDQLTQAKLKKLQKTASLYAGHYPELVNDKRGWRIDLVAISVKNDSRLRPSFAEATAGKQGGQGFGEPQENCDIKHYENIG